MSQNKVYRALMHLGERTTTSELRTYLEDEYPDSKLHLYASDRLRKLEEKGVVEIDDDTQPFEVRLLDDDWEGIPSSLANRSFPPESGDSG
ncbi:hypothetical protein [Halobacterium litoreum]|uniref:Uncharacterized protein n=1 Tax=Halobacterium litoreum TaxID=2039234 RepID=A0ABD5NCR9_9EURY|nr:hypothetical protein [Halobacterium litoreum]UHH14031.1 hypothetical protein LT972_03295 [Halobacterium litoreum]